MNLKKRASKTIALALVAIFVSMPLFNTASAMEITDTDNTSIERENSEEIQTIRVDKSELEELQKIVEDAQNNKPRRVRRSTGVSLGDPISTMNIIGLGLVTIYTGGVIIKGAIIKAGTSAFDTVKNIVEPYIIGAGIPNRLKKDGNTVDLGKFTDKVKGKSAYKNPKTGWTVEKDNDGHKGSKWKLKDKNGKRKASLRENGDIAGK